MSHLYGTLAAGTTGRDRLRMIHHLTLDGIIPDSDNLCKSLCGKIIHCPDSDDRFRGIRNTIWMADVEGPITFPNHPEDKFCAVCLEREPLASLAHAQLE